MCVYTLTTPHIMIVLKLPELALGLHTVILHEISLSSIGVAPVIIVVGDVQWHTSRLFCQHDSLQCWVQVMSADAQYQ